MKIKINSDDDSPLEKTIAIHNVVIFLEYHFNESQNNF